MLSNLLYNSYHVRGKDAWINHCEYEHNVFSYAFYLINIQEKTLKDCDEIEKFVKKSLQNNDYSFLPTYKAIENTLNQKI